MLKPLLLASALLAASAAAAVTTSENFIGSFAEPRDGGNLDLAYSSFDGTTVTIVPRAHASEAVGGAVRWRNVLFAIRGVQGKTPVFRLPLTSPGSGRMILSGDAISFQNIKLVWSYEPNAVKWNAFDTHTRTGTAASSWRIEAQNVAPFTEDVVYVSINEHYPVGDYYEWLESQVFVHPRVRPTASEVEPGSFVIGYQSGAAASSACSRAVPDMPLFGFVIRDPAAQPTQVVMLVSGQHPYEGQNKVALESAVEWILNSPSDEARAYRARYVTLVYPFVNPTGELAGLWRGTAYQPSKDVNRNWQTTETVPSRNRGIDTVIVHKNAMQADLAAIGLGTPYAVFDYHQNFGDHPGFPDYVLHSTLSLATTAAAARQAAATDYAPFYARLAARASIADMPSDPTSQETLRGLMVARGVTLPLTFERSVYNSLASEWAFGLETIRALVDPAMIAALPPAVPPPASEPPPVVVEPPASDPTDSGDSAGTMLVTDEFTGSGSLNRRLPDGGGTAWAVENGIFKLKGTSAAMTNNSGRATIDAAAADVEVSTTVTFAINAAGLVLRETDGSNYLRFVITPTSWLLQKTAGGGTATLLKGNAVFATGQPHTLVATLSGNAIALAVDGTTLGAATVEFNQTATRHGLLASGSGDRSWLSFAIKRAAGSPTGGAF